MEPRSYSILLDYFSGVNAPASSENWGSELSTALIRQVKCFPSTRRALRGAWRSSSTALWIPKETNRRNSTMPPIKVSKRSSKCSPTSKIYQRSPDWCCLTITDSSSYTWPTSLTILLPTSKWNLASPRVSMLPSSLSRSVNISPNLTWTDPLNRQFTHYWRSKKPLRQRLRNIWKEINNSSMSTWETRIILSWRTP